ncbi:hypothetical protein Tco_0527777 [Tanacetum coccineum]
MSITSLQLKAYLLEHLLGDLKNIFEPNEEDEIWKNQQDYNLISWRLFDTCGIHMLLMHTGIAIHMMIEKKYPLTQEMLSRMLSRRLEVDQESEMAFELLSTEGPIPPKTAEQKLARKNELKAKSILLLAIPDEHLLKFLGIKDAKTLWEAIKARSKGLDKTYDRFQKLISQLEIHGEVISQEDANLKLLRSLPLAWNNIALIMRNKSDLDTMSMDDLYNNLKVYEAEIKSQSSSSSNSQNVAFVSSENTSSTNEAVNTAHEVSTTNLQGQASSLTYADDVMFSFFINQSNSPQLDNEDLEQIDTDDLEEMDLKWQVVMLTMRVKRFLKKTGRNLNFNGKETVGFDKTKALVVQDGICGYDWSYQAKEVTTDFALMAHLSSGSSSSSSSNIEGFDTDRARDLLRLVPSCFAIFDLEPLLLSFDFVFTSEIFKSLSFCLDRLCRLVILCLDQHAHTLHHLESLLTISLDRLDILKEDLFEHEHVIQENLPMTGFPAQSVGSSNIDVLDLPCLLVLITGTSQSRQHDLSESDSYYLSD